MEKLELIDVVTRPHPMSGQKVITACAVGKTISQVLTEIVAKQEINDFYTKDTYVELNGVSVPEALWETTRVYADSHLVVQFNVPCGSSGGEKKNPLRTILTIVVMVVAAIVTWGMSLGAYGAYAGLAGAATMAVGTALINAIVPIKGLGDGPNDSQESKVYSIEGMTNGDARYRALPMVLGFCNFAPPFGARSFTALRGNDQYLYCDFVWGYGKLDISELTIEGTSVDNFQDIQIASNPGAPTDSELKLYTNDVYEDYPGVEVREGAPVTRSVLPDTEEINLDLVFNRGLVHYGEQGEKEPLQVDLVVSVIESATGYVIFEAPKSIEAKSVQPLRKHIELPEYSSQYVKDHPGVYDVTITRITPNTGETDTKNANAFTWSVLRSIKFQDPVTFPVPIAETQLVIRATDQLSGTIDSLKGLAKSVCLDWDKATGTWIERATNNPASLFRYIYQSNAVAIKVGDDQLDLEVLEDWHEFCEAEGFTYNKVHDSQESLASVVSDVCASGRASFTMVDDMRSVVVDKPTASGPVQLFTPANSSKFTNDKVFLKETHGYRCQFNNASKGLQEDEVFVYTEGYNEDNANIFEALQMPGVTDAKQIQSLAKYHLGTRRYRPETFSWETDWEHVICSRGDLVQLSHYVLQVGFESGRVKGIDGRIIKLDQPVTLSEDRLYGLRLRPTPDTVRSDNGIFTVSVRGYVEGTTAGGVIESTDGVNTIVRVFDGDKTLETVGDITLDTRESSNPLFSTEEDDHGRFELMKWENLSVESVEITTAITTDTLLILEPSFPDILQGDLYTFGIIDKETIDVVVTKKVAQKDMRATITGVMYAWDKLTEFMSGEYPDFDSGITTDLIDVKPAPLKPVIQSVVSNETVLEVSADGTYSTRLVALVSVFGGTVPAVGVRAELSYLSDDPAVWVASPDTDPAGLITFSGLRDDQDVTLRVQAVSEKGVASAWTTGSFHVVGKTTPPLSAEGFHAEIGKGAIVLKWNRSPERDFSHYEVRQGSTWDNASPVYSGVTNFFDFKDYAPGDYNMLLRVFDASGLSSGDKQVNYTIVAPRPCTLPEIALETLTDGSIRFNYIRPEHPFEISEFEVYVNGSIHGKTKADFYIYPKALKGSYTFGVAPVDVFGNKGTVTEASIGVSEPAAPSAKVEVIDNNVNIYVLNNGATSFPVEAVKIYKGNDFGSSTLIGKITSTFAPFFENNGGLYTYWASSVDLNGNEGLSYPMTVIVSEPPDFILFYDENLVFDQAKGSQVFVGDSGVYLPVNPTESWQEHFQSNNFLSPQEQQNAGYPYYLEPVKEAATYVEEIDYGTILTHTKLSVIPTKIAIGNPSPLKTRLEYREKDTDSWTIESEDFESAFIKNVRYIRITASCAPGAGYYFVPNVRVRFDLKQKKDGGTSEMVASDPLGTWIEFGTSFYDVVSISTNPYNRSGTYAQFDFLDAPKPLGFYGFLLDGDGQRLSGKISWSVIGV